MCYKTAMRGLSDMHNFRGCTAPEGQCIYINQILCYNIHITLCISQFCLKSKEPLVAMATVVSVVSLDALQQYQSKFFDIITLAS